MFSVTANALPSRPDFNGDGFDDLAIGVPNDEVAGVFNAGSVQIIYGSASGLVVAGNQRLTQNSEDVPDDAEESDRFGNALAWGDFNGDGFSDLAIGCEQEDVGDLINAGAVTVLYGTPQGLRGEDSQLWTQNVSGVLDEVELNDQFGWALAAGDFDGDGRDDLAIGIIGEDVTTPSMIGPDAGAVHVLYGSLSGLRAAGDDLWTQNSFGVPDVSQPDDRFGYALASGDFDGNGFDDLAIGAAGEDGAVTGGGFGVAPEAGAVNVIYGSQSGLNGSGAQVWSQNSPGIGDVSDAGDRFGFTLAAGDFNGDGDDDLAIAAPFEDSGPTFDAGMVHVLHGTNVGLRATGSITFDQISLGFTINPREMLGFALAAGNFDGDGEDDLAVSAPREAMGPLNGSAGAVIVLRGSSDSLSLEDLQVWTQDSQGVLDHAEFGDRFGESLRAADFNGDGENDLAIGVPHENIGMIADAGAVNVLYGSTGGGLTSMGDQLWHRRTPGIKGGIAFRNFFGWDRTVID